MDLVLGLGNPGGRYVRTRHNAGWHVVEELRRRLGARDGARHETYREWVAEFRGQPVSLVEPLTFMNLSGEALEAWSATRGPADRLLVVADDVYLPVGLIRLRASGSSGGHRGLESIEAVLGSREFARLRVGVGAAEGAELRQHVLDEPAADEMEAMAEAVRLAADAVECWLGEGILAAMNRFNRKVRKEATES